jgi:hypothetical protein
MSMKESSRNASTAAPSATRVSTTAAKTADLPPPAAPAVTIRRAAALSASRIFAVSVREIA